MTKLRQALIWLRNTARAFSWDDSEERTTDTEHFLWSCRRGNEHKSYEEFLDWYIGVRAVTVTPEQDQRE